MENIGRIIKSPEARKYIYLVVIGAIPVLVTYGLITEDSVDEIVILIGAILGLSATGLAVANTPSKVDELDSKIIEAEILADEIDDEMFEVNVEEIASNAVTEINEVKNMLAEILYRLDEEDALLEEELGE